MSFELIWEISVFLASEMKLNFRLWFVKCRCSELFSWQSTFCHPIFFGENLSVVTRACFNLQDFVYSLQRYFFQSFCGVRFSKGALGPNFLCGSTKKVPAWWESFRLTWLGESIYFPQLAHSFSMGTWVNIFSDLKKYHVEEWRTLFEGP